MLLKTNALCIKNQWLLTCSSHSVLRVATATAQIMEQLFPRNCTDECVIIYQSVEPQTPEGHIHKVLVCPRFTNEKCVPNELMGSMSSAQTD